MTDNRVIIYDENGLLPEGADEYIQAAAKAALETEGACHAFLELTIVGDEEIQALNRDTRGVDSVTDVLSYPEISYPDGKKLHGAMDLLRRCYDPAGDGYYVGCVALNIKRAREQASEYGHSLKREIAYLTCHAALHLCGYDHMTEGDKAEMREREKQVMKAIEIFK